MDEKFSAEIQGVGDYAYRVTCSYWQGKRWTSIQDLVVSIDAALELVAEMAKRHRP